MLDVTSQNDTGLAGDLFALVWSAEDQKLYALNSADQRRRLDPRVFQGAGTESGSGSW